MKKWAILIVVVLAAALLIVQYSSEKKKGAMHPGTTATPAGEDVGVALPSDASKPVTDPMNNFIPQSGGGPLSIPLIQTSYKGACEGGSLKDMLETHDKYWGTFAKDTPFNSDETRKMYGMMEDYVACHSAARADVSLCDSLPGSANKDGIKVTLESSPSFVCRKKATMVFFEAYQAGRIKDDSSCRLSLANWDQADLAHFSAPKVCELLAKGPGNVWTYLVESFAPAPEAPGRIAAEFPVKEGDCKKDEECLLKLRLYNAAKNDRPNDCPVGYKAQCQALAERSTVPCDKILQDMSKFYCDSVARVKKTTGGYIGASKEEIAEDIRKTKEAKLEAEARKKEQEKLQAEVNTRIKEVLKKK